MILSPAKNIGNSRPKTVRHNYFRSTLSGEEVMSLGTYPEAASPIRKASPLYPEFIETPFVGWMIDPDKARALSILSPWRSTLRIVLEWAVIFGTIFVSHLLHNP